MERRSARLVSALLCAAFVACNAEVVSYDYRDFSSAEEQGALQRKTVPAFLPRSAQDIRGKHNIDTNEVWVTFHFDEADDTWLAEECGPIDSVDVIYPRPRTTNGIDWWPSALSRSASGDRPAYRVFSCTFSVDYPGGAQSYPAFAAVDAAGKQAWFWVTARQ